MVTRKLEPANRAFLRKLGKRIEAIILKDRGYKSLDAFSLEFHDLIAKPTLYAICGGRRDMKISTLRGLANALDVPMSELIQDS